jgi:putative FmdB family regulatory protein
MPIYEYRRPDGSTFDVMQSFSEEPLTHDPETGVQVQRVLHPPALHFKGKGFYNTDYGTRKRQRETADSEDSGGAKDFSSSSSDTATDSSAGGDSESSSNGKGSAGESKSKADTKQGSGSSDSSKSKPAAAKS